MVVETSVLVSEEHVDFLQNVLYLYSPEKEE